MAAGMPELGSRISLISKADIRYEGKLFTVDPHECTIALSEVRSFGTEDRETSFPVPVQSQIYDFILFRGSDIKDIRVLSTTIPNDPAIVQLSVPPTLTGTQHIGYPANGSRTKNFANLLMSSQHPHQLQQVNQHPVQNHMQSPLQNQAGPSCGYPNQPMYPYNPAANIGPVPVLNSGFNVAVPLEVQGLPNQQPSELYPLNMYQPPQMPVYFPPEQEAHSEHDQITPYTESDISTTKATANTKEAQKEDSSDSSECADVSQQRPKSEEEAGTKPVNKFPQENRWSTQQRERQNYVRRSVQQQQQGTQSGYNRDANHTAERSTGGGYRQTNSYSGEHAGYRNNNYAGNNNYAERGHYRQGGYGDRSFRNDSYHQGYSTARQSAGSSGAASWSGYTRAPRRGGTGVPRAGYRQQGSQSGRHRQSSFEGEYDFETANSKFEELKSQLSKMKIDDGLNNGENEKKEDAEEAAPNNNNDEKEKDEKGVPKKFYDKTKSFFDQISCEAIERSKGNVTRVDWRHEYRLNSETFGLSPYRQQYDYRGNYGHHHQSSGYRGGYYYRGGNYMNRYHRGGGHRRQHTGNIEGGASYNQQVAVGDASKD